VTLPHERQKLVCQAADLGLVDGRAMMSTPQILTLKLECKEVRLQGRLLKAPSPILVVSAQAMRLSGRPVVSNRCRDLSLKFDLLWRRVGQPGDCFFNRTESKCCGFRHFCGTLYIYRCR
jgi:hypothetical protein